MYITFSEYVNLGGTLTESTFNSLIYEAQVKLDYHTFNRLKKDTVISINVKRCLCKILSLMDVYTQYEKKVTDVNNPILASQSNDGVSASYGGYLGNTTPNDINVLSDKLNKDIKQAIQEYLHAEINEDGQRLLYRGVYR